MKTLTDHVSTYAAYHRDRRNIATHFVGIPMIVFASTVLLGRLAVGPISLAMLVALGSCLFYLRLDLRFGALMTALFGLSVYGSAYFAAQPMGTWLAWGPGLFFVGWVIQFIGHYYEGRKPAFVDDLIGLLVGPLFVVAELGFMLGLRGELNKAIEERVGPTWIRPAGTPPRALFTAPTATP
jgi:uncharacterized membrane protein YGL010W